MISTEAPRKRAWKYGRTKSTDDLRLELELALEATGEERDMTLAIMASVGDVTDYVEHRATCASQDNHQGDELPQPSVLYDRPNIRPGRHEGRGDSGNGREREDYGEPVCGPVDFGDWTSWQITTDPVPNRFRGWRTDVSCKQGSVYISSRKATHPEVKSNRTGSVLATANSPVEGWKSRRTGAVCSPSWW